MKTMYRKVDGKTQINALKALVRLFKARPTVVRKVSGAQLERAMKMLPGVKVDKTGNYFLVPSSRGLSAHEVFVNRTGEYPVTDCDCEFCETNKNEICAHKVIARAISEAICNPM